MFYIYKKKMLYASKLIFQEKKKWLSRFGFLNNLQYTHITYVKTKRIYTFECPCHSIISFTHDIFYSVIPNRKSWIWRDVQYVYTQNNEMRILNKINWLLYCYFNWVLTIWGFRFFFLEPLNQQFSI